MLKKQNYNTKARRCILDFLETQQEKTVSAADIINYLENNRISVNPATVYRYLNKLSDERMVLKFTGDEPQKAVYQFIGSGKKCEEHIHVKCVSCGKLLHLECGFMRDIKEHLYEEHGFTLQCEGSILYGVCGECRKKEK